jgi:GNAT superfamily N-acetyltransferase
MPVRPATPADLEEIAALITELAEYEDLRDHVTFEPAALSRWLFGPDPAARVAIAEAPLPDGGVAVAGFALWFRTFSTFLGRPGVWLEDLFVRPAHRGRGLGGELLRHVRGLTDGRVEWSVLDWNEPAVDFYRHLGAVPVTGWTTFRWAPAPSDRP